MKRREFAQAFLVSLVCGPALAADPLPTLRETPMFADQVKSGALPPIGERIPTLPWVVKEFAGRDGPGRQGGQLNMLVANARDTSLMTVYSYTRPGYRSRRMRREAVAGPNCQLPRAADERTAEIGQILAHGLMRLLRAKSSPLSADCRDSFVDLPAQRSGHAARTTARKA